MVGNLVNGRVAGRYNNGRKLNWQRYYTKICGADNLDINYEHNLNFYKLKLATSTSKCIKFFKKKV